MLEEEHGVVVADGGLEQALGVVGGAGAGDLEAGHVDEEGLRALACWAARVVAPHGARMTIGTDSLPPDM